MALHLFSSHSLTKSFGAQILFENIDLFINEGDRIGLIGPNGSGKSTLLKVICGLTPSDEGTIRKKKHLAMGYLGQEDCFEEECSILDHLLSAVQHIPLDETERHIRAHTMASRGGFPDPQVRVHDLSGGWRKRLSICSALIVQSDILVMDEPTNHLDVEGILWLEKILTASFTQSPSAYLLVSHDRRFLENCTNRMIEISPSYPQGSFQVDGSYSQFVEQKEKFLMEQMQLEARLAGKVKREVEWLRRGPKARTTKARYRVDDAHRLQDELQSVRSRNQAASSIQIGFDSTGRRTKKLLVAKNLSKHFGQKKLFSGLDMVLSPGSRLGLLGRNGCGKSTLMEILAQGESGYMGVDSGSIRVADGVQIESFDQRRQKIDKELTLRRALAPDGDSVNYQGRVVHVVSWAKRFLFRVDQLETPVGRLSGGEQARILIAGLMRRPADILLLDEPTNDLDIPSLDVLQECLLEFPGALVLVSHDRYLLDQVCDRILGFDGEGGVQYYSDYEQYLTAMKEVEKDKAVSRQSDVEEQPVSRKPKKKVRLSYLDQREYDGMEEKIMEAEVEEKELENMMEQPETIADPTRLQKYWQKLEATREKIAQMYARWEELEEKKTDPD